MPGRKTRYICIYPSRRGYKYTGKRGEQRERETEKSTRFVAGAIISTVHAWKQGPFSKRYIVYIRLHPLRLIEPHTWNALHNEHTATRVGQIYLLDLHHSSLLLLATVASQFVRSVIYTGGNAIEIIKK